MADAVIGPDGGKYPTDGAWRDALSAALDAARIGFVTGAAAGVDEAITCPQSKRRLFEATGALCVDMESHAVMRAARDRRVPWLAIRAIADAAGDTLPDIALAAVDAQGRVRAGALAARLCRRPAGIVELISLWWLSRPAFAGLGRVAALPSLRGPL